MKHCIHLACLFLASVSPGAALPQERLFDQQRLVNYPGAGAMGADVSSATTTTWSLPIWTWHVADDFAVTDPGGWAVTRIRVYAYVRTDPPTSPSPLDQLYVRIWDAAPWEPTANVVFGDATTNRLAGSGWSHIYFIPPSVNFSSTARPVFYADAVVDVHLPRGTYWIDYTLGPLPAPLQGPDVPMNPAQVGNAHWNPTSVWSFPLHDTMAGLPFRVYGEVEPAGRVGSAYCDPAVPNSTGFPGLLEATGSSVVSANDVTLTAWGLPNQHFGYFLNSMSAGATPNPGGSQGILCLGGSIGRYRGSIASTAWEGSFSVDLDLTNTPTPGGLTSVASGETWYFQCWYRDHNPGPTSNLSSAIVIPFQ